jgi:hypothetical protein
MLNMRAKKVSAATFGLAVTLMMAGAALAQHQTITQASPIYVPLVPVYKQCGTPANPANATRNAPLSTPACNPPAPTASRGRVGPTSIGTMQGTVLEDDPSTGADEADIAVTARITDVTDATTGMDYNPGAGANDDLTLLTTGRITDEANTCGSGPCHATSVDVTLGVPMNCTPTANATIGSTCSASTTLEAVFPGLVGGGFNSNTALFRIRVLDAGPNGVREGVPPTAPPTGDDTLFEQQGIWVP